MGDLRFKVLRILEEQESPDRKHSTVTKKEFVGEIESPKREIYVTSEELLKLFGEGYYLAEIPPNVYRRYLVPDKQFIRTPMYFEPSRFVHRIGARVVRSMCFTHSLKTKLEEHSYVKYDGSLQKRTDRIA